MVIKRGGAKCPCGRRGCMEAYAGRAAMEAEARRRHEDGEKTDLFKLMEKHNKPRLTSSIWGRAIDNGDKLATELIDRAIEALGTGIASAINLLDPEEIIIGGGLGLRFGDRYMDQLLEEMRKHVFFEEMPDVKMAELGDLGGAIGASLLVSNR
jgi:glucokinase